MISFENTTTYRRDIQDDTNPELINVVIAWPRYNKHSAIYCDVKTAKNRVPPKQTPTPLHHH